MLREHPAALCSTAAGRPGTSSGVAGRACHTTSGTVPPRYGSAVLSPDCYSSRPCKPPAAQVSGRESTPYPASTTLPRAHQMGRSGPGPGGPHPNGIKKRNLVPRPKGTKGGYIYNGRQEMLPFTIGMEGVIPGVGSRRPILAHKLSWSIWPSIVGLWQFGLPWIRKFRNCGMRMRPRQSHIGLRARHQPRPRLGQGHDDRTPRLRRPRRRLRRLGHRPPHSCLEWSPVRAVRGSGRIDGNGWWPVRWSALALCREWSCGAG